LFSSGDNTGVVALLLLFVVEEVGGAVRLVAGVLVFFMVSYEDTVIISVLLVGAGLPSELTITSPWALPFFDLDKIPTMQPDFGS